MTATERAFMLECLEAYHSALDAMVADYKKRPQASLIELIADYMVAEPVGARAYPLDCAMARVRLTHKQRMKLMAGVERSHAWKREYFVRDMRLPRAVEKALDAFGIECRFDIARHYEGDLLTVEGFDEESLAWLKCELAKRRLSLKPGERPESEALL